MTRRLLMIAALMLVGCPGLPPPDGCPPGASRCSPGGAPQVCSPTQRWTAIDDGLASCVDVGAECCLIPSIEPGGRPVHGCARPDRCLEEPR